MHGTFISKNFTVTHFTALHFPSLHFKIKSRQFTPHHYTSHHFTYLHSPPTWIPFLVITFLTLFLNVFSLRRKDASKPAGTWFQLLRVLFTKEYLPTFVFCLLFLIFQLWSSLRRLQSRFPMYALIRVFIRATNLRCAKFPNSTHLYYLRI